MKREEFSMYERLKVVMEDWAEWIKGYNQNIGWPSRSVGLESGYSSSTFDDLMHEVDQEANRIVDAAVNDLDAGKRAAIHRCYGLCSVFRFPRGNYEDLLIDAHTELLVTLPKKGVIL